VKTHVVVPIPINGTIRELIEPAMPVVEAAARARAFER
jgi:hypothetical protein